MWLWSAPWYFVEVLPSCSGASLQDFEQAAPGRFYSTSESKTNLSLEYDAVKVLRMSQATSQQVSIGHTVIPVHVQCLVTFLLPPENWPEGAPRMEVNALPASLHAHEIQPDKATGQ